jgi:HAD superfamily hydrolase (TIGR01509 family)
VIFDLDGVLLDSEPLWDDARRGLVEETGGSWRDDATRAMMGMSSLEWSRYMREELGVPMSAEAISAAVLERVERLYRERLPLIPGARQAVTSLAARWPLALASSANRSIIALALELADLSDCFRALVSSEEVARGKPAPDVYLEAARRISREPSSCVAVEDSSSGLRAAAAAGMWVIAIPNAAFPPEAAALALADVVLPSIADLNPGVVAGLGGHPESALGNP